MTHNKIKWDFLSAAEDAGINSGPIDTAIAYADGLQMDQCAGYAYICGQISNNPNFKQQFQTAEDALVSKRYIVFNPAKITLDTGGYNPDSVWATYMGVCLHILTLIRRIELETGVKSFIFHLPHPIP